MALAKSRATSTSRVVWDAPVSQARCSPSVKSESEMMGRNAPIVLCRTKLPRERPAGLSPPIAMRWSGWQSRYPIAEAQAGLLTRAIVIVDVYARRNIMVRTCDYGFSRDKIHAAGRAAKLRGPMAATEGSAHSRGSEDYTKCSGT